MMASAVSTNLSDATSNSLKYLIADLSKKDETSTTAFWAATLRFRQKIQQENIVFTNEDFAGLRDRSVGREVEFWL